MTTIQNGAEGQANTIVVTPSNSRGTSGTAFDVVNTSSTCSVTFDSTHSGAHGSMAYKILLGSIAGEAYTSWTTALTSTAVATVYARAYVYLENAPTSEVVLFRFRTSSAVRGSTRIDTTGHLTQTDANGNFHGTMSTAIPLNQWVRIEAMCTGDATAGVLECKLFTVLDSVTADETLTASSLNTGGTIDRVRIGHTGTSVANNAYWIDDLGASTVGYLGPVTGAGVATGTAYDATTTTTSPQVDAQAALATGIAYDELVYIPAAPQINFSDVAVTNKLGASISQTDLTMYCQDPPYQFPNPPFVAIVSGNTFSSEAVLVTGGSGTGRDPWVIQRGYHSTVVKAHNSGELVEHRFSGNDALDIFASILQAGTTDPEGTLAARPGTYYLWINTTGRGWHGNTIAALYRKVGGGSGPTGWVRQ